MKKEWNGLVTLEKLWITDENNKIIFEMQDKKNVLHVQGQALFLGCMFKNVTVPNLYYVGLDSRSTITASQTLANLTGEPTVPGYSRQPLTRTTDFELIVDTSSAKARSATVSFTASATSYTASDMFLCTASSGTNGLLISTVSFGTTITVSTTNVVSMKFAMTLGSC
jgi:hypothetical protein